MTLSLRGIAASFNGKPKASAFLTAAGRRAFRIADAFGLPLNNGAMSYPFC